MAGVTLVLEGDEAKAWAAVQRLVKGTADLEKGMSKVGAANKQAAAENKELERAALRVFEGTRTPMEAYSARLDKLSQLYARGKIDLDTYRRGAGQLVEQLDKAGAATEKTGHALAQVSTHGKHAFGEEMLHGIKHFAMHMAGISTAGAAVVDVFHAMKEQKLEAAKENASAEFSEASLRELSRGDQKLADHHLHVTRQLAANAGMPSEKARALFYQANRANAESEIPFFGDLYSKGGYQDPAAMVKNAEALRRAAGGKGTLRAIVGQAVAASQYSPTGAGELLDSTANLGDWSEAAGLTTAQALALNAVLSKTSPQKGPSRALQLSKAFGRIRSGATDDGGETLTPEDIRVQRDSIQTRLGLAGKSPMEILKTLKAANLPEEDLKALFPKEALAGFTAASRDLDLLSKAFTDTEAGGKEDAAGKVTSVTDPMIDAARIKRVRKAKRDKKFRELGTKQQIVESADEVFAEKQGTGWGGLIDRKLYGLRSWVSGAEAVRLRGYIANGVFDEDPELLRKVLPYSGHSQEIQDRILESKGLTQAAADLSDAAREHRQGNPTLSKPDQDH